MNGQAGPCSAQDRDVVEVGYVDHKHLHLLPEFKETAGDGGPIHLREKSGVPCDAGPKSDGYRFGRRSLGRQRLPS